MDEAGRYALEAKVQAQAALDGVSRINGDIRDLRTEVAGLREDHQATREAVIAIKTRAGVYAGVGAFAVTAIVAPLAVGFTIRFATPAPPQAGTPKRPSPTEVVQPNTAVAESHTAAQRGAQELLARRPPVPRP